MVRFVLDGAGSSTVVIDTPSSSLIESVKISTPENVSSSGQSQPTSSQTQNLIVITCLAQSSTVITSLAQSSTVITSLAQSSTVITSLAQSSTVITSLAQSSTVITSLAKSSTVITTRVSSHASTGTPVIQTSSVTIVVTGSSPQTSVTTLFNSSVPVAVTPSTQDHSTTAAVVPSPQTSFTTLFTSSVSINATSNTSAPQRESLYIEMTFKMPWRRLCFLRTLFKEALSDDLIEMKDLEYELVKPARIKLMNDNAKCENKKYYNDKAVLKFYISNSTEDDFDTVDKEMTIKAFKILYDYWVNKKMKLLDQVFEKKVSSRQGKNNTFLSNE